MQVFRIIDGGSADKVMAFDELPQRLLEGIEMKPPAGLPRHWKEFLGKQTKIVKGTTFLRPDNTKLVVPDEVIEGAFFYILDPQNLNADAEKWAEITSFCKRVVPPEIRLLEKLEDMALPMAPDSRSELTLEPEHLEERGAIIPIPLEYQEKLADKEGKPIAPPVNEIVENMLQCNECEKKFANKQALRMHDLRAHKKLGGNKPKEVAKV